MGHWLHQARTAAALAWHTATGSITWLHTTAQAAANLDWSSLLRWAALAAALTWLGWTSHDLATGAAIRRAAAGTRHRMPAYALGTAAALLAASLLIR